MTSQTSIDQQARRNPVLPSALQLPEPSPQLQTGPRWIQGHKNRATEGRSSPMRGRRNGYSDNRTGNLHLSGHERAVICALACRGGGWNKKNEDPPWTGSRQITYSSQNTRLRQDPDVDLNHGPKNLGRNTWKQQFIYLFLAMPSGMEDLSSLTKDWTCAPAQNTSLNHWIVDCEVLVSSSPNNFRRPIWPSKTSVFFSLLFPVSLFPSFLPSFPLSFLVSF